MSRNRSRRSRRIRNILLIIAILGVSTVSGMMYLRQRVSQTYAEDNADTVESEAVTTGSLSTTVPGSGTLQAVGTSEVTLPSGVEISKIFCEEGSSVSEGDLLFSVDSASVLSAMKQIQNQIDTLDQSLEEAGSDEVSESLTSGVSGRVKKIYAEEGDDVSSVMYEEGALAVLSLDGYMAVEIKTDQLSENETVTVVTSDDTQYTGTVESAENGTAVITLTDDGPQDGDTVTVLTEDEEWSGTLRIHSPLSITGYAGTVSAVNVSENTSIDADTSILTLTDTSYTANYNTILSQRTDLEETLQELIVLYREGGVYAALDGVVDSITDEYEEYIETDAQDEPAAGSGEEAAAEMEAQEGDKTTAEDAGAAGQAENTDSSESTVLTINPGKQMTVSVSVDETNILSMELGQSASVTIDSIGDDVYEGTVTAIDTAASSSSGVSEYTVEVTIDRTEKMLVGMSASVTITIDGIENALLVPAESVRQNSTTSYVYTSCDESGELGGMVEVTTGMTDGSQTEIISGLKEGDVVYYEKTETSEQSGRMGAGMEGFGGMSSGAGMPSGNSRPGSSSGNNSGGSFGGNSGNASGGPSRRSSGSASG